MILLSGLLYILLAHLLLPGYLFLVHSLLVASDLTSEFIVLCFDLQLEVFLGLVVIIVEEIKVLYQELTASSCFLLLFLQKFLGCFVVLLKLIVVANVVSVFLETHAIIAVKPVLIYNCSCSDH